MRLANLVDIYVYRCEDTKIDGEITKEWIYKDTIKMNAQQDISELDRKSSGLIDYEVIKLRKKGDVNILKNDGVSFVELSENEIPPYIVNATPKIGTTSLIICNTYNGE